MSMTPSRTLFIFPWISHRSIRHFFPFVCLCRNEVLFWSECRTSRRQLKSPLLLRLNFLSDILGMVVEVFSVPPPPILAHTQIESLKDSVSVSIKLVLWLRANYLGTFIYLFFPSKPDLSTAFKGPITQVKFFSLNESFLKQLFLFLMSPAPSENLP